MIRYFTGCAGAGVEAVAHQERIGLLIQPGNRYHLQVAKYPDWAGDNGAFTTVAGGFDPERFRAMLRQPELAARRPACRFVVAPDRLVVHADGTVTGDAVGTLAQFPAWAEEIRGHGFPVAIVAQDGLEQWLEFVPWGLVDVLFIGGSTEWKLSSGALTCVLEARRRGKRTHMGRVNSYKRLALADSWGVDSADGTFLKFGMTNNVPRMLAWFRKLEAHRESLLGGAHQRAVGF